MRMTAFERPFGMATIRGLLAPALMAAGMLAATAAPVAAQTAAAQAAPNQAEAQTFIRKVADESLVIIQDKSLAADAKKAQLRTIFTRNVAMDYIATLALGRYGRIDPSLPADVRAKQAAQIAEYRSLFPEFIFNRLFTILISKFDNSVIDVIGSTPVGNDLYVNTRVKRPQQEPVLADWRIRADKSAALKVIDLKAEGVSLTITQRDEFATILGSASSPTEGLDKLLTYMKDSIAGKEQAAPVQAQAKSRAGA